MIRHFEIPQREEQLFTTTIFPHFIAYVVKAIFEERKLMETREDAARLTKYFEQFIYRIEEAKMRLKLFTSLINFVCETKGEVFSILFFSSVFKNPCLSELLRGLLKIVLHF